MNGEKRVEKALQVVEQKVAADVREPHDLGTPDQARSVRCG